MQMLLDSLDVLLQFPMLVERSNCADEIQNGVEAFCERADSDHRHQLPVSSRLFPAETPVWRGRAAGMAPDYRMRLPASRQRDQSPLSHPPWLSFSATITLPSGFSPRRAGLSKRAPTPHSRSCAGIAQHAWVKSPTRAARQFGRQHHAYGKRKHAVEARCRAGPRT